MGGWEWTLERSKTHHPITVTSGTYNFSQPITVVAKSRLIEAARRLAGKVAELEEAEIELDAAEARAEGYREALEKLLEWAEHGEGEAPSGIRMTEALMQARAALRPSAGENPQ